MPVVEFFPYLGPNRRSDKTVVEITLVLGRGEQRKSPLASVVQSLIDAGVLADAEGFPESSLPDDWMAAYASLLAQTALLLQREAGHRVNYFSVDSAPDHSRCRALVEHEHCDVGMSAVKLASELLSGRRKMLAEPFRAFKAFAQKRLLPIQTEAIIKAAQRRDIPAIHLERQPFKREDFAQLLGRASVCTNGLLMLGHGQHQHVLDGTWSLDLDRALSAASDDVDEIAGQVLDRLFPPGRPARIPVIAITGTNGKTTTTRMLNHIMRRAGKKPGMVCTDGVFFDGQQAEDTDQSSMVGHLKVLTNKKTDIALLETHHAGILNRGFAFRWCDIAVCLNVSEDHLGDAGVESVEEMARVKQALVERARYAAVLNADDPYCRAMLGAVKAEKACLVSMQTDSSSLQELAGAKKACCCVLEQIDAASWLVIYDEGQRIPVISVAQIPATFGGRARFNTSNAMHAVATAHLVGIEVDKIQLAMASFVSSYQDTPGRLNIFDDLPFRIVMDFAHNPQGMEKLCEFTDQLEVTGRKLVAFSGSANRTDETIQKMGHSVAGHFDFYFCKEYVYSEGKASRKTAHLVQQGLLQAGVAQEQTVVMGCGKDVIFEIFDTCKPGDLLVMMLGHVEKHQLKAHVEEYAGQL